MPLTVSEQLTLLAELARLDQKAKVTADRLESLPAAAKKAEAQAAKLKTEIDSVLLRKSTAEQVKKAAETDIADERAKLRKWESRSADIRGAREATALGSEIGGAKRHIRQQEDIVLEQMEAIEAADKDVAGLTKKHTTALDEARAEWAKVEGDISALQAEIVTSSSARRALLEKLPGPVVKRYETIAGRKQGVGVAIIDGKDICSACNRAVPPQLCIQVMKGQIIESCPACMRLLVHHSMTQAPAAGETHG
jgi:predicted  nucleic acid-binding Zn-ribbon protein